MSIVQSVRVQKLVDDLVLLRSHVSWDSTLLAATRGLSMPIKTAILYRFSNVRAGNVVGPGEISDGARDLEYAMVGARG